PATVLDARLPRSGRATRLHGRGARRPEGTHRRLSSPSPCHPTNTYRNGRVMVTSQQCQSPGRLRLSAREREALQLTASGMTPAEAAAEMGVCTSRVNDCLRYASAKLHSLERPGAVHRAYLLGEISPPERTNDGVDLVLSTGQQEVLRGLAGGQD